MISVITVIQFIIFSFVVIPLLYLLIRESFYKRKKYKMERIAIYSSLFLIAILLFVILSICIVANNDAYDAIQYGVFYQMWIIIKYAFKMYLQTLFLIIIVSGITALYILLSNSNYSNKKCHLMNIKDINKIVSKLTIFDKCFKYSYFYLESKVLIRYLDNNTIILSDSAYYQGMKYLKRNKKFK